jgi:hypothetical protein
MQLHTLFLDTMNHYPSLLVSLMNVIFEAMNLVLNDHY